MSTLFEKIVINDVLYESEIGQMMFSGNEDYITESEFERRYDILVETIYKNFYYNEDSFAATIKDLEDF